MRYSKLYLVVIVRTIDYLTDEDTPILYAER